MSPIPNQTHCRFRVRTLLETILSNCNLILLTSLVVTRLMIASLNNAYMQRDICNIWVVCCFFVIRKCILSFLPPARVSAAWTSCLGPRRSYSENKGRSARAGQLAVPQNEKDPPSRGPQWTYCWSPGWGGGVWCRHPWQLRRVSIFSLELTRFSVRVFRLVVSLSRSLNRAEVGQERWTV